MSAKTGGDEDPVNEERAGIVREVGSQAVWSLSSCKPGNTRLRNAVIFYATVPKTGQSKRFQVSEWNSYGTIVSTHTGNRMVNYHISLTFNFSGKPQSIRSTFTPITSWTKAIHPAKYR